MAKQADPKFRTPWRPPSLTWPITLGTIMIVLVVALIIGWVLLSVNGLTASRFSGLYLFLLVAGIVFLVFVLLGVVFYLTISIKAINLNQRQSNFIDSVTHELKSPIASLKLYLQTLNRHEVSERQRAEFYRSMLEDVERLDRLINQMLIAARITQETSPTEIEDVALDVLIRSCVESVRMHHRLSADAIKMELEPVVVRGRRIDVELIFRNLIDNAAKYAGKPPEIAVHCHTRLTGKVVVTVSDNGRGVPPAWRRRIFGRFVRLGSELERDKPGTGLGLYLASEHVKKMRGAISVRGRDDKPGSVFEVVLPGQSAAQVEWPTDGPSWHEPRSGEVTRSGEPSDDRLQEPKSAGSILRRAAGEPSSSDVTGPRESTQ
ncbi:MAG TPA: HAMP domain-containing sensor histidine kinase [Pirellulales bacterium]